MIGETLIPWHEHGIDYMYTLYGAVSTSMSPTPRTVAAATIVSSPWISGCWGTP